MFFFKIIFMTFTVLKVMSGQEWYCKPVWMIECAQRASAQTKINKL